MKKSDSFIEDRIRWRAGQHGLRKGETMFWEDAPKDYKTGVSDRLGIPVILSFENEDNHITLCTRGSICRSNGKDAVFLHSQISSFDGQLTKDPVNYEIDYLVVNIEDGRKVKVETEKGEALSMIWNILLMLKKMS